MANSNTSSKKNPSTRKTTKKAAKKKAAKKSEPRRITSLAELGELFREESYYHLGGGKKLRIEPLSMTDYLEAAFHVSYEPPRGADGKPDWMDDEFIALLSAGERLQIANLIHRGAPDLMIPGSNMQEKADWIGKHLTEKLSSGLSKFIAAVSGGELFPHDVNSKESKLETFNPEEAVEKAKEEEESAEVISDISEIMFDQEGKTLLLEVPSKNGEKPEVVSFEISALNRNDASLQRKLHDVLPPRKGKAKEFDVNDINYRRTASKRSLQSKVYTLIKGLGDEFDWGVEIEIGPKTSAAKASEILTGISNKVASNCSTRVINFLAGEIRKLSVDPFDIADF